MKPRKIPRRVSTAIINSVTAGVVPRIGLEHINVGRKIEIEALIEDLNNIAEGGAAFRFIVGRYGSGKTFLLQLLRNQAMERGYVVADVDLSPERRLTGTNNSGLNTYRELMKNLSTKTMPDGGALSAILERWISTIQSQVLTEEKIPADDPTFNEKVEQKIHAVIDQMEDMVHGFDYARVITAYWHGHVQGDDDRKDAALRWLRGEFTAKTDARQALGVRVIVEDNNWYEYLKLFASFISAIGYKGLIVLIDEAVNLYKISNRISRENNYEKLLTMFNDTMQGKANHIGIIVGSTPQFMEDKNRGVYSYEALKTRLSQSRFVDSSLIDVSGPVINLKKLDAEEIYLMLRNVLNVYIAQTQHDPALENEQIQNFMQVSAERLGSTELLTPRDVVRDFISVLNLLRQNPERTFSEIIGAENFQSTTESLEDNDQPDTYAEFEL